MAIGSASRSSMARTRLMTIGSTAASESLTDSSSCSRSCRSASAASRRASVRVLQAQRAGAAKRLSLAACIESLDARSARRAKKPSIASTSYGGRKPSRTSIAGLRRLRPPPHAAAHSG
jgi:hypothetical protein